MFRNTVNLCIGFTVYYLIGYKLSNDADGGIIGNGKFFG